MLELREVCVRADGTAILDGIDLDFARGRFHVVLGPNGAGKSTLLRVATGLLEPTSGTALLDGRPLREIGAESLARRRAVLSQHVDLAFPLSVAEVVLMGRYPHYARVAGTHDHAIVDRALGLVGMERRREQPYPTLSGGERQKVHLARVLAQIWNYDDPAEHRYLFLDEPTNSLDVHYQIHLLDVARGLLEYNCTVVAVLHDINVALQYGDRFVVLDGGLVAGAGDASTTLRRELLERVFAVRAHPVADPENGDTFWRFSL